LTPVRNGDWAWPSSKNVVFDAVAIGAAGFTAGVGVQESVVEKLGVGILGYFKDFFGLEQVRLGQLS